MKYGRTSWLEVSAADPLCVVAECEEPILDLGEIGSFDDSGANIFSVVDFRGRKLAFYQGWQRTERVQALMFTGLAVSDGGVETFRKPRRTPVLDRVEEEPFIRAAPFVMAEGDLLRMWYASGLLWTQDEAGVRYLVDIRHAWSHDGEVWHATGPCLSPAGAEYGLGRPWVIREGGRYHMWYSVRSTDAPYKLAYAESLDGLAWKRMDDRVGIERSAEGWDSEMMCYPAVVRAGGRWLLFYNGNSHGQSGFGCAAASSLP